MSISRKKFNFKDLVEQGNDLTLEWPVALRHRVWKGKVCPDTEETRPTLPLLESEPFWSFALLGKNGEPSEQSIVNWVDQHGLLHKKEEFQPEEPGGWDDPQHQPHMRPLGSSVFKPEPITLEDFRVEVRTAYQLLRLYAEIRGRNTDIVMRMFSAPVELWPRTPLTPIDRDIQEYQHIFGQKYEDLPNLYLRHGRDIIIRCTNFKLRQISPMVAWNWWDAPPQGSASVGLVRWWAYSDLLSAMYLQFYLLITEATPVGICANPHCRNPFPVTRGNRRFCKPGCRSTGRNYR